MPPRDQATNQPPFNSRSFRRSMFSYDGCSEATDKNNYLYFVNCSSPVANAFRAPRQKGHPPAGAFFPAAVRSNPAVGFVPWPSPLGIRRTDPCASPLNITRLRAKDLPSRQVTMHCKPVRVQYVRVPSQRKEDTHTSEHEPLAPSAKRVCRARISMPRSKVPLRLPSLAMPTSPVATPTTPPWNPHPHPHPHPHHQRHRHRVITMGRGAVVKLFAVFCCTIDFVFRHIGCARPHLHTQLFQSEAKQTTQVNRVEPRPNKQRQGRRKQVHLVPGLNGEPAARQHANIHPHCHCTQHGSSPGCNMSSTKYSRLKRQEKTKTPRTWSL